MRPTSELLLGEEAGSSGRSLELLASKGFSKNRWFLTRQDRKNPLDRIFADASVAPAADG